MKWVEYQKTILERITHPGGFDEGAGKRRDYPRFISHGKLFDAPNQNLCCQDFMPEDSCIYWILAQLRASRQGREY